jgi:predicted permease
VRDLPYEAPEELVSLYRDWAFGPFGPLAYPDYLELKERTSGVLSGLEGYQFVVTQRDVDEQVEVLIGGLVTGNYFPMLGIPAYLGRTVLPEDDVAPGAHPVVVLGFEYWQRSFGADPDVLGGSLRLGGQAYTIIGVAPGDFPGPIRGVQVDFFAPVTMLGQLLPLESEPLESRGSNSFWPIGRMDHGATLMELTGVIDGVSRYLRESYPEVWQAGDSFVVAPTRSVVFNPAMDRTVVSVNFLAMGFVVLVLFIACANLVSMLLARAVERRKDVALRLALGASRGRLIRQLLTESLLYGLLGGAGGLILARWILHLGQTLFLQLPVPLGVDLRFDWTVLGFTLAVSLATGVAVGLVPALRATRLNVAPTLKDEGSGSGQPKTIALSRLLVAGQVAVSVVLLVSAGLFLRSFDATKLLDPGFGQEPTAVLSFIIPRPQHSQQEGRALVASFLDQVRAVPGVTHTGIISNLHLNTLNRMLFDVNVEGVPPPPGRSGHSVDFTSVGPEFFAAAGIRILEGRNFTAEDRVDGQPVAVINEAMARRFWPEESPLGRTVVLEAPGFEDRTVVGVVSTAKIRSLGEEPHPFIYLPFDQEYNSWVTVLARTRGDPAGMAQELHRLLRSEHPELIVTNSNSLAEHIGIMFFLPRLVAILAAVFAAMALGLVVVGLWGVVSYAVVRRTREMGIRLSLGAEPHAIVALLVKGGFRLVLLGGTVGMVGAVLASRALSGFLVGVSPLDPLTFLMVTLVLFVTAFLAAYLPARRASQVDPVIALRAE